MRILKSIAKFNLIEKISVYNLVERLIQLYIFILPWQALYIFDEKFWDGFKWQYGTGALYATELLLWLIFLIFFLSKKNQAINFTWSQVRANFKKVNFRIAIVITIWAFVTWSGLSIFWSPDKSAAFYLWFKLLELTALLFVILASRIEVKKLLWPLALAAGAQGLIAGWQFTNQTISASTFFGMAKHLAGTYGGIVIESTSGRWLRAYGTFVHPNILGGFCALGLLATILLTERNNTIFWLKIISIFSTMGLFLSFSRSAWLATTIAIIYLLIFNLINKTTRTFIISLVPALLTATILALCFHSLIFTRIDFANRLENQSISLRVSQVSQAWEVIIAQPLTGVGLSNYTLNLKRLFPAVAPFDLQPAHNIYLLLASETGVVGLFIFFGLLILLCGFSFNQKTIVYLSLPLTLLIIGLFDHYLITQYTGLAMLWLSLTFAGTNYKIDANVEH